MLTPWKLPQVWTGIPILRCSSMAFLVSEGSSKGNMDYKLPKLVEVCWSTVFGITTTINFSSVTEHKAGISEPSPQLVTHGNTMYYVDLKIFCSLQASGVCTVWKTDFFHYLAGMVTGKKSHWVLSPKISGKGQWLMGSAIQEIQQTPTASRLPNWFQETVASQDGNQHLIQWERLMKMNGCKCEFVGFCAMAVEVIERVSRSMESEIICYISIITRTNPP